MGYVQSLFDSKELLGVVSDIDKDLHEEISFFIELERQCNRKLELARKFAETWDIGDFKDLREHIESIRKMAKKEHKLIPRFKRRIENMDHELLSALHEAARKQNESNSAELVRLSLTKLRRYLELADEPITEQLRFFSRYHRNSILERKNLRELLAAIQREGEVLEEEHPELSLLKERIEGLKEQRGLMTLNELVERFTASLSNEGFVKRFYELRGAKAELEKLILNNDLKNEKIGELLGRILEGDELGLIESVRLERPMMIKIGNILKRALESKKYDSLKKDLEILYELLGYLVSHKVYAKLQYHIRMELMYLKRRNFEKFMMHFQKEKTIMWDVQHKLVELGIEFDSWEQIRAGYSGKLSDIQRLKTGNLFERCIYYAGLCVLVIYFHLGEIIGPWLLGQIKDNANKRHILNRYEDSDGKDKKQYGSTLPELLEKIEKFYGVKVTGRISAEVLRNILNVFQEYYPQEVKRSIRKIVINPSLLKLLPGYGGLYHPIFKIIAFKQPVTPQVIAHEVGHAIANSVPISLVNEWKQILRKSRRYYRNIGVTYPFSYYKAWKDDIVIPQFGFIRAYGTKNHHEDIATFFETRELINRGQDIFAAISKTVTINVTDIIPYYWIYIEKANLLVKYGLFPKATLLRFVALLDIHIEKINNTIEEERKASMKNFIRYLGAKGISMDEQTPYLGITREEFKELYLGRVSREGYERMIVFVKFCYSDYNPH